MTNEEIAVALAEDRNRIKSLEHRITDCEKRDEMLNKITISVEKLATNMEYMVKEQKEQGKRLEKLEQQPSEDFKYYKRLVVGCVATTLIGAVIGAVLSVIL